MFFFLCLLAVPRVSPRGKQGVQATRVRSRRVRSDGRDGGPLCPFARALALERAGELALFGKRLCNNFFSPPLLPSCCGGRVRRAREALAERACAVVQAMGAQADVALLRRTWTKKSRSACLNIGIG